MGVVMRGESLKIAEMEPVGKRGVIDRLQSIAIFAVQAQRAVEDENDEQFRECLDDVERDLQHLQRLFM
jgi:hypothetical protein